MRHRLVCRIIGHLIDPQLVRYDGSCTTRCVRCEHDVSRDRGSWSSAKF